MFVLMNGSLGAYFMADVSERAAGKEVTGANQKEILQMRMAAAQGVLGTLSFANEALGGEYQDYMSSAMLVLYTGLTAYTHFAYDDKAVAENRELAAIRELQSNIAILLDTNEAGIETRLNTLIADNNRLRAENADISSRREALKTGLRQEYNLPPRSESPALLKAAEDQNALLVASQKEVAQYKRKETAIGSLVTGGNISADLNQGVVKEVKDALTSRDQAIASERQQNVQLREDMSVYKKQTEQKETQLKNQIQGIEKERDEYQRKNSSLLDELQTEKDKSSAKDVTIDNQAEQIQSQLSEIEALKLQLRQAQQRSNTRGTDRAEEFDNKVAEAAEGLSQAKLEDVQGVSTSNNSKLPTKGGQGYGRGGGNG